MDTSIRAYDVGSRDRRFVVPSLPFDQFFDQRARAHTCNMRQGIEKLVKIWIRSSAQSLVEIRIDHQSVACTSLNFDVGLMEELQNVSRQI